MNEQVEYPEGEGSRPVDRLSVEQTGNDAVDAVLRSLDGLDDRPLGEHVKVFEAAHENLRAALTGAGDGDVPRPGPR